MRDHPFLSPRAAVWRAITVALAVLLLLTGCPHAALKIGTAGSPGLGASSSGINPALTIRGQVNWSEGRTTQANIGEIATGATVSFIDAASGQTVSTALTDATGHFVLQFSNSFSPPAGKVYYIEAVKGLSAGGLPNRAGASAARVRTAGQFMNGTWATITSGTVDIDPSTTALCVIASLRNFVSPGSVSYNNLVGSIPSTNNSAIDPFTTGSTNITSAEYSSVFNLVSSALLENLDPVAAIQIVSVSPPAYTMVAPPVSVTGVVPALGHIGDTVVIAGVNFSSTPGANTVEFNGVAATSVTANSLGTLLTVVVPPGATTGPLVVAANGVVLGDLSFRVLSWDGHTPFDTTGNLYVSGNAINAIFQIPPWGGVQRWLTTTDYPSLSAPAGITVDASNDVFVANSGNNTILEITPAKVVSVYASGGALNNPQALAFDKTGNLYVANRGGGDILVVPPGGGTQATYCAACTGMDPVGLAFDPSYNLWVSNEAGNEIEEIASGSLALTAPVVGLNQPYGIAFDASGNLYIGNFGGNQVLRYTPSGALAPYVTSPGVHQGIRDVAYNTNGVLDVGAYTSHTVFSIDPHGAIQDLALAPTNAWNIARDSAGNLYFGENNNTQRFRGRNANGDVYVAPWDSTLGSYDPFIALVGGFSSPTGVAFDSTGQLYVGDSGTQRVYQVDVATRVKTLYTSGVSCSGPGSIAFDSSNTLLMGDRQCYGQTLTTGGAWSNYSLGKRPQAVVGDGTASLYVATLDRGAIDKVYRSNGVDVTDLYMTGLNDPTGLAWYNGDLYVAEAGANRIDEITAAGTMTTYAAVPNTPVSIVFDSFGNAYVACQGDNTIQKIPAGGGSVATFATGLDTPEQLVLYNNTLFVTNTGDFTIKQVSLSSAPPTAVSTLATVSVGTAYLRGLAVDGSGTLYASGMSANTAGASQRNVVFTVPSTGGTPTLFTSVNTRTAGLWYGMYNSTNQLFATNFSLNSAPNHMLVESWTPPTTTMFASDGIPMYWATAMAADSTNRIVAASGRYSPMVTRWTQGANGYATGVFEIGSLGGNGAAQIYDDVSGSTGAIDNVFAAHTTGGIDEFVKVSDYSFTVPTVLGGSALSNSSGVVGDSSGNLWVTSMGGSLDNVPFLEIPKGQTTAVLVPNWIYDPEF